MARGGRPGDVQRPRRLGGAVRPRRRPALPRGHRLRALLRRGQQPGHRALRLARRPRHLGRDRAGRARRRHRCRLKGIRLLPVLDAMAPGVLVAQAIGRWGNWFNQELFGRPTDLPWGLEIDADAPADRPDLRRRHDVPPDVPLRVPLEPRRVRRCVIWADRRFQLGHGRVVALYVMVYTAGRGWIEYSASTTSSSTTCSGLRLNVWTSIVLFVAAAVYFVVAARAPPRPRGGGLPPVAARPAPRRADDDGRDGRGGRRAAEAADEAADGCRPDADRRPRRRLTRPAGDSVVI